MVQAERFAEVAVIGGGVVGLAIGERFARAGREVVIIEAQPATGTHTSSRNSGVIHALNPYALDSLKARFCLAGNTMLYQYSKERGIPHQRIGKITVATRDADIPRLQVLYERGKTNGVGDLTWLGKEDVRELEPAITAEAGISSPSTGIIDVHAYMEALKRDIKKNGGIIMVAKPVTGGRVEDNGILLSLGGSSPKNLLFDKVINSAGLFAQKVARSIEGIPQDQIPPEFFAKGHYYRVKGKVPFNHLVYPIPEPELHGLGTHLTVDMGGYWRAGPDIMYVNGVDYSDQTFTPDRQLAFYNGIMRFWPGIQGEYLEPDYVGIRPKTGPQGSPEQDFTIHGPEVHKLPMVHLYGIESPGITGSLPIADWVFDLIGGQSA